MVAALAIDKIAFSHFFGLEFLLHHNGVIFHFDGFFIPKLTVLVWGLHWGFSLLVCVLDAVLDETRIYIGLFCQLLEFETAELVKRTAFD